MTPTPDRALVERLAALARIDLAAPGAPDIDALVVHLQQMLAWVDELDDVDVEGVQPTLHPVDIPMRLRPDVAIPAPGAAVVLRDAPAVADDLILVPRVVDDHDGA